MNVHDWWRYLLRKWLILLCAGVIGGGVGLFMSLRKKTQYVATLSFVLEEDMKVGAVGGLASMAGINIGGGGVFQGDNIYELYRSRTMLTKTLLSQAYGSDSLLVQRYIAFNNLKETWQGNKKLAELDFTIPKERYTLQHDSLLGEFVRAINDGMLTIDKPNKSTNLILVETTSLDEKFSKEFTEILVQNVNEFYIETKTKKALDNLAIIQFQVDSVRSVLNDAISGVAKSIDANPNPNAARQTLKVPSSRREVDVQANQVILTELVKNLEMAKISLRKETPLIQIIDAPILPLKKERLGKAKGMVSGGLIAGVLTCLILILRRFFRRVMIAK